MSLIENHTFRKTAAETGFCHAAVWVVKTMADTYRTLGIFNGLPPVDIACRGQGGIESILMIDPNFWVGRAIRHSILTISSAT